MPGGDARLSVGVAGEDEMHRSLVEDLTGRAVRRRAEDTWSTDQAAEATHSAASIKRGFIQLVTALGKSSTAQNPEELSRVRATLVHETSLLLGQVPHIDG